MNLEETHKIEVLVRRLDARHSRDILSRPNTGTIQEIQAKLQTKREAQNKIQEKELRKS